MKTYKAFGAALALSALLIFSTGCPPGNNGTIDNPPKDTLNLPENSEKVNTGTVTPRETEGAIYPDVPPKDRIPNNDEKPFTVPEGPKRGDMEPRQEESSPRPARIKGIDKNGQDERSAASIAFKSYSELTGTAARAGDCCPEPSVAANGQTVMHTGNNWMALSKDGGATWKDYNPTTIFPEDYGGFCCDQVLSYVPKHDMFVWLLQYWADGNGDNIIRIAIQQTPKVISSNGTAWTYWDFKSDFYDKNASLDYNDMSFGDNNLWWCTSAGGKRYVSRVPLSQLAAKTTVNFSYTGATDAFWSHVTQNGTNTVYWGGHINNSQMRVYSMKDSDGFYSWRTVNINSWPNGTSSSLCPDGTDWLADASWKTYLRAAAVQDNALYFGWNGTPGGGFPQTHVQIVKINTNNWTLSDQFQVWNKEIAFAYPNFDFSSRGELGMSVAFGGKNFYASHAVGIWGDFVVYYPRLSDRATTRWGHYQTTRRMPGEGGDYVSASYTRHKENPRVLPHYIRWGR